jgi:hypothetical protein
MQRTHVVLLFAWPLLPFGPATRIDSGCASASAPLWPPLFVRLPAAGSFPAHSHLALDKGFVCWSVSIPLRPPPLRIRVYKSPVLYGAGTPNLVWHLGASGIDATLSERQISQHHHENHRPDNYPKHDFLPALLRKSITAASTRHF